MNNIESLDIIEIFHLKEKRKRRLENKENALNKTENIFAIDGKYIWDLGKKYKNKETNVFDDLDYFEQMVGAVLFIESIYRIDGFCISDLKIKTINKSVNDYDLKHIAERYLRKIYDSENDREINLKFQGKNIKVSSFGYISRDAMTAVLHYYDFKIKETKNLTRFFNISKKIINIS